VRTLLSLVAGWAIGRSFAAGSLTASSLAKSK